MVENSCRLRGKNLAMDADEYIHRQTENHHDNKQTRKIPVAKSINNPRTGNNLKSIQKTKLLFV